jgi:hypothetical protein
VESTRNLVDPYPPKIAEREAHGDTYARYCLRCKHSGIEPGSLSDWLAFEVKMAKRHGAHIYLDVHQQQRA